MKKSEIRWRLDHLECAMVDLLILLRDLHPTKAQRKRIISIAQRMDTSMPILLGWKKDFDNAQ